MRQMLSSLMCASHFTQLPLYASLCVPYNFQFFYHFIYTTPLHIISSTFYRHNFRGHYVLELIWLHNSNGTGSAMFCISCTYRAAYRWWHCTTTLTWSHIMWQICGVLALVPVYRCIIFVSLNHCGGNESNFWNLTILSYTVFYTYI